MALTKALGGTGGVGSALTVKDEGTTLSTAVTSIDFVGAGVTATGTTAVTVTIPSGSGAEVLITETVLAASAATISFSSIANTYRDLRVVVRGRGTKAASFCDVRVQVNGDTTANYDHSETNANGAFNTNQAAAGTSALAGYISASTGPANVAGAVEIRFYDYRGTTFQKTWWAKHAVKLANSSGNIYVGSASGFWRSTSAITSIALFCDSGNFDVGTVASLYGIL